MRSHARFVSIGALLLGGLLAGCVGDGTDDGVVPAGPGIAEDAVATAKTGSVTGQVLTIDLEPVVEESLVISAESNITEPRTTRTDLQGRFTFNDLEPGRYRVHMAAECCAPLAETVEVEAGDVARVSWLVDRVESLLAYINEEEWTGFIACGVGQVNACYLDPSNDREIWFFVEPGLKTFIVGVVWQTGGLATELEFTMDRWQNPEYHYDYARVTGPSPLRARVDDAAIPAARGAAEFANITEEGVKIRFILEPTAVAYQQPFTVYWQEHYNRPAPEDIDPIPDG